MDRDNATSKVPMNRASEPAGGYEPRCSVVIPTRGRPAELARCLEAVARLEYSNYVVYVVDNAPTDRRSEEVAIRWGARYLVEPVQGVSRARNRGARSGDAEIIAFLDDDAVPEPGWLRMLAKEFRDPQVMVVGGRISPLDPKNEEERLISLADGHDGGVQRRRVDRQTPYWFELSNFGALGNTTNMAFRRSAFDVWKGFDERIGYGTRLAGSADHNAIFSLVELGYRAVYNPDAVVYHAGSRTPDELRARRLRAFSTLSGYMVLLLLEHPQYWRSLVRYLWRSLTGAPKPWLKDTPKHSVRVLPHWREFLAFLRGPLLYARAMAEYKRIRR